MTSFSDGYHNARIVRKVRSNAYIEEFDHHCTVSSSHIPTTARTAIIAAARINPRVESSRPWCDRRREGRAIHAELGMLVRSRPSVTLRYRCSLRLAIALCVKTCSFRPIPVPRVPKLACAPAEPIHLAADTGVPSQHEQCEAEVKRGLFDIFIVGPVTPTMCRKCLCGAIIAAQGRVRWTREGPFLRAQGW